MSQSVEFHEPEETSVSLSFSNSQAPWWGFFQCQSSLTDFIFRNSIFKMCIIIPIIFSAITHHNLKILFIRENKIGLLLELPNSNQKQKSGWKGEYSSFKVPTCIKSLWNFFLPRVILLVIILPIGIKWSCLRNHSHNSQLMWSPVFLTYFQGHPVTVYWEEESSPHLPSWVSIFNSVVFPQCSLNVCCRLLWPLLFSASFHSCP